MNKDKLDKILSDHNAWLKDSCKGKRADLRYEGLIGVDLRGVNLSEANLRGVALRGADLRGVNMRGANLHCADLGGSNLSKANLGNADLSDADLSFSDLRDAELCYANLSYANLSDTDLGGADLDFSTWPLWCGALSPRIDKHIAAQLLYHALRAMQSCADDPDVADVLASEPCLRLANQFHRVDECGKIERSKKGRKERQSERS